MKQRMCSQRTLASRITVVLILTVAAAALAQPYDLSWRTVDGGGQMFTTGGSLVLSGTIGQPEPGVLTGGTLALVGGFWAVTTVACPCPGDLDGDGERSGTDIQYFTNCVLGAGSNCICAEVDGVPGLGIGDVSAFVSQLLGGAPCP